MVVPVDPDEGEAEDVRDESGQEVVPHVPQRVPLRRPQLEGHDRDDHREHGIEKASTPEPSSIGRAPPPSCRQIERFRSEEAAYRADSGTPGRKLLRIMVVGDRAAELPARRRARAARSARRRATGTCDGRPPWRSSRAAPAHSSAGLDEQPVTDLLGCPPERQGHPLVEDAAGADRIILDAEHHRGERVRAVSGSLPWRSCSRSRAHDPTNPSGLVL